MSTGWTEQHRRCGHRLHRSEQEARECRFNPQHKDFTQFPDHTPKRKRKAASGKTFPLSATAQAASTAFVDEEDVNEDDGYDSSTSSVTLSRASTPPPLVQETGYPTPVSQEVYQQARMTDSQATPTPTPAHRINNLVAMTPDRLLSRLNDSRNEATSSSNAAKQPLAPPVTFSAHVMQSIENHNIIDDNGGEDTRSTGTPPLDDTDELNDLRNQTTGLVEELRDQTALSTRLFTRNRIHVANLAATEHELHGVQENLQLAWHQVDAEKERTETKSTMAGKGTAIVLGDWDGAARVRDVVELQLGGVRVHSAEEDGGAGDVGDDCGLKMCRRM